jgi:small subunit ribosomal protein S6
MPEVPAFLVSGHPSPPVRPVAVRHEEVLVHTYETLFITSPTLTEEEETTTVQALAQVVGDGGGVFAANDRMGRRRLAYPILKHQDGVYVRFLYDAEPAVPKELERRLRLSDKVLRSLTIHLEPDWAEESKQQAIRDAQARVEAAERAKLEAEAAEAAAAAAALLPPPVAEAPTEPPVVAPSGVDAGAVEDAADDEDVADDESVANRVSNRVANDDEDDADDGADDEKEIH